MFTMRYYVRRLYRLVIDTLFLPRVGTTVQDCNYERAVIVEKHGDDVLLSNGRRCSLRHCCDW